MVTIAAVGIRRTPLERAEYAIIVSTLVLMVAVCVQPILNLLAISFSDPARVPGMSGLTIVPEGFFFALAATAITSSLMSCSIGNGIVARSRETLHGLSRAACARTSASSALGQAAASAGNDALTPP